MSGASATTARTSGDVAPLLTDEQRRVVEAWAQPSAVPGRITVVNSFAGTGKTTLLCALVDSAKQQRRRASTSDRNRAARNLPVLYLCYNKATQLTAEKRMPTTDTSLVVCRTYHSLALQFTEQHVRPALAQHQCTFGVYTERRPYTADGLEGQNEMRVLRRFWRDGTDYYGGSDAPCPVHADPALADVVPRTYAAQMQRIRYDASAHLQGALQAWQRMRGLAAPTTTCVEWPFDAMLKYFTTHAQTAAWMAERFSSVIVDEAQDVQAPLLRWLMRLSVVPVLLVGDAYQSIYAWNGACNAVQTAQARIPPSEQFALTQSFRFGADIADLASTLLHRSGLLAPTLHVRGRPDRTSVVAPSSTTLGDLCRFYDHVAVLGRTNRRVLEAAMTMRVPGARPVLAGKTVDLARKCEGLARKWAAQPTGTKKWMHRLETEYSNAVERGRGRADPSDFSEDDRDTLDLFRLIQEHGARTVQRSLSELLSPPSKKRSPASSSRTVTLEFSTSHGAKGLEWEAVYMLDDYPCLTRLVSGLQPAPPGGGDSSTPSAAPSSVSSSSSEKAAARPRTASVSAGKSSRERKCACGAGQCRDSHAELLLLSFREAQRAHAARNTPTTLETLERIRAEMVEQIHLVYVALTRAQHALVPCATLEVFCHSNPVRSKDADDEGCATSLGRHPSTVAQDVQLLEALYAYREPHGGGGAEAPVRKRLCTSRLDMGPAGPSVTVIQLDPE